MRRVIIRTFQLGGGQDRREERETAGQKAILGFFDGTSIESSWTERAGRAAKSNKCLEQQKASIASGKVDVAATAVNATNQNKKSGTSKTTANNGNKAANGASKGTKRPRSTKAGFQALKKGGGGGADMLDGLVQAALLSQMDNKKKNRKERSEGRGGKESEGRGGKESERRGGEENEASKERDGKTAKVKVGEAHARAFK